MKVSKEINLSIILPVYNVEPYLRECLDSVYDVDIDDDFEVIAVNDGSTDGSLAILEEYSRTKNNFILLDQPNQGPHIARNEGLARASGTFIYFFDSDDILTNGISFRKHIEDPEAYDMIMFDALQFYGDLSKGVSSSRKLENEIAGVDPTVSYYPPIEVGWGTDGPAPVKAIEADGISYLRMAKARDEINPFVWRVIFRRDFLSAHHLWYHREVTRGEDLLFLFHALLQNPRILYVDVPVVLYRIRGGGITGNYNSSQIYESCAVMMQELVEWKKKYMTPIQYESINWMFDVVLRLKHRQNPTWAEAKELILTARRHRMHLVLSTYLKLVARTIWNLSFRGRRPKLD